ncbi:tyrosine-type recombinase/integrase [Dactylosporangium sp. NPDC050688]|uniref:tyrosine-type recombinase/integrase n=1 Tax=Dactylosporangium sp. NPDC050688 TaxID=3157217 RepID=UPI0033D595E3
MTAPLIGEILLADDRAARAADEQDLTVLRDEWLLEYGSANTRSAYRLDINHWLQFLASSAVDPLHGVQRKHTLGWLRAQELQGAAKATRARRLAAVIAFYDWLTMMGHFALANPAAVERRRRPHVDRRSESTFALSREQTVKLLAAADGDHERQSARTAAIVWLLVFTGIRVSELVSADVEGLGTHDGHRVLRFVAKGDVDAMVVIPDPVWRRLERYLQQRPDVTITRLPARVGQAGARRRRPLFVTASGGRLDRGAVARMLCRLGQLIGVAAWLGPHVLRATCVTLARAAGVALEDIQDQLGHADGRAVRRYDHGGVRLDRAPAYALVRYLEVA